MEMPSKMLGLLEDCLEAWKNSGARHFLEYANNLMSNYKNDERVIELKKQYSI